MRFRKAAQDGQIINYPRAAVLKIVCTKKVKYPFLVKVKKNL
jgi:hypothetical protein